MQTRSSRGCRFCDHNFETEIPLSNWHVSFSFLLFSFLFSFFFPFLFLFFPFFALDCASDCRLRAHLCCDVEFCPQKLGDGEEQPSSEMRIVASPLAFCRVSGNLDLSLGCVWRSEQWVRHNRASVFALSGGQRNVHSTRPAMLTVVNQGERAGML